MAEAKEVEGMVEEEATAMAAVARATAVVARATAVVGTAKAAVATVTAAVAMGLVEEEAVVTLTVEEEAAEDGFAKLCYSNQTSYFRQ
jgi:hypothetical protein